MQHFHQNECPGIGRHKQGHLLGGKNVVEMKNQKNTVSGKNYEIFLDPRLNLLVGPSQIWREMIS